MTLDLSDGPASVAPTPPPVPPHADPRVAPAGRSLRTKLLSLPLVLALGALTIGPVLVLIVSSFNLSRPGEGWDFGWGNWSEAFNQPAMREAVTNTLTIGAARVAIGTTVALLIAWLIARTDLPGRRALEFFFWLAIFMPALPLTLGWILLLEPQTGIANEVVRSLPLISALDSGPFDIYSFWGIVWVQVTSSTIPYTVVLTLPAFRRMGAPMEEAARMCGASRLRTGLTVTLPLLMPAIIGAVVLGFVYSLQSFEVELLLGAPIGLDVYSTQIYRYITGLPPNFGAATALGSVFLVTLLVMAAMQRRYVAGRDFTTMTGHSFSDSPIRLSRVEKSLAALFCWGVIAVSILLPVAFLVIGSFMRRFGFFGISEPFTADHWRRLLADPEFASATGTSLMLGLLTAAVGLAVYFLVARRIVRSNAMLKGSVDTMAWLPVAIPGILLGVGLLWIYLATPLRGVLYGSLLGLIIALVISQLPIGTQQLKSALLQVSPDHEMAAKIAGAGKGRVATRIVLPLIGPTVASALILTFASAIRDISTVVLLASRDSTPLSLLMLEFSMAGRLESAAAVGVLLAILMLVFAIVSTRFISKSLKSR